MNQTPDLIPWFQRAGFDVQEFSAAGIRTFAVVEGRRDQFPVIFLHGFPGGAFLWTFIISALGRKRLALAPDFPGWGNSVSRYGDALPPPTPEWSLNWLNGLLAAQNIERCDLVAHGNGAWLPLELLMQDPARVRRLSLIAPRLWPYREFFGRFRRPWTESRVQQWLSRGAALTPESQQRFARDFAELCNAQSVTPMLREKQFIPHFESYRRALSEFRGRTLLIWGEHDPAYSKSGSESLEAILDRPEVHRLAESGHFPMLDQPQSVTQLLKEFLED